MLALHGFESYGLEVSQVAVDTANQNIKSQLADPAPHNFGDTTSRPTPANAKAILGDFFQKDWTRELGEQFEGFDLIYDYTVCFLPPPYLSLPLPLPQPS